MELRYSTTLFVLFFSLNRLHYSRCREAMTEAIVNVKQGALKGQIVTNIRGGEYYSFQGIPYAKPPLGQLRFKAPLPPDSWEGIRDATKHGQRSLQIAKYLPHQPVFGSEDCLYLNVYTPELPTSTGKNLKPVMMWIHGGAFAWGSGDKEEFGPDYLVNEDVIVVTINYRLGLLGFLRIDDSNLDAPGNAGLKDMVMALKWIQENIINFGGDPDNVTVFGESAGGASAHLLVLSPLAKGLFHKAIIQSPPSLEMIGMVPPESNYLPELLKLLNIGETDNAKILQILRELPADELLEAQSKIDPTLDKIRYFLPTVEKPSKEPAFLIDHPFSIIQSGNYNKVPLIFGYNSREGTVMANDMDRMLSNAFEDFVPYQLKLPKGSIESKKIAEEIKTFYFGGRELSKETANELILLLSDTHFLHGIHKSLVKHLRNIGNDMFLYRFSVEGKLNFLKKLFKIDLPGASHADELAYLFVNEFVPEPVIPNSMEDLTIKRMVKLWTSFAKFGNPIPKEASDLINITWQPIEENDLHFLEIGENLTVGINPDNERMKFWDRILGVH